MTKNTVATTYGPITATGTGGTYNSWELSGAGSFQLASGHYYEAISWTATAYASQVAADTDSHVVFPRPNSETAAYSRQRWAHPDFDYEVPVLLKNGAFPYQMEIDTGNTATALLATITIGANFDSVNSYVVNIPAATIAALSTATNYDIYIKATDQAGKEIKIWWTFQKEAAELDHFFFVDKSYVGGTKDGKFDTPFDNLSQAGWLAPSDGASAGSKILVVKEADSVTTPYTKTAGWNWTPSAFPCAIIGIPTEEFVLDLEGARAIWGWNSSTATDGFLAGFKAVNGLNTFSDDWKGAFTADFGNEFNRACIWDLTLEANVSFTPSSVNPSCFNFNNITNQRRHVGWYDLRISNAISGQGPNGGGIFDFNGCDAWLVDKITVSDWGTSSDIDHLIFSKRSIENIEIRRVEAIDNVNISGSIIDIRAANQSGDAQYDNIVVTRCNLNSPNANEGVEYLANGAQNFTQADGPFWMFFNTVQGAGKLNAHADSCATLIDIRQNATTGTITSTVTGATDFGGAVPTPTLTDNKASVSGASFNADGTLTTSYLSAQSLDRGEVGHEIA